MTTRPPLLVAPPRQQALLRNTQTGRGSRPAHRLLHQAHAVLREPESRAQYDKELHASTRVCVLAPVNVDFCFSLVGHLAMRKLSHGVQSYAQILVDTHNLTFEP